MARYHGARVRVRRVFETAACATPTLDALSRRRIDCRVRAVTLEQSLRRSSSVETAGVRRTHLHVVHGPPEISALSPLRAGHPWGFAVPDGWVRSVAETRRLQGGPLNSIRLRPSAVLLLCTARDGHPSRHIADDRRARSRLALVDRPPARQQCHRRTAAGLRILAANCLSRLARNRDLLLLPLSMV